jgi:hypothetical protein
MAFLPPFLKRDCMTPHAPYPALVPGTLSLQQNRDPGSFYQRRNDDPDKNANEIPTRVRDSLVLNLALNVETTHRISRSDFRPVACFLVETAARHKDAPSCHPADDRAIPALSDQQTRRLKCLVVGKAADAQIGHEKK